MWKRVSKKEKSRIMDNARKSVDYRSEKRRKRLSMSVKKAHIEGRLKSKK
jgi:hypothetical protein